MFEARGGVNSAKDDDPSAGGAVVWRAGCTVAGRRLAPSNTVVDGPGAAIDSLGGLAVGRDGSGGLVYLKNIGATAHVFVSTLVNGSFQPPVQMDAGLPGASSQPVIAATTRSASSGIVPA